MLPSIDPTTLPEWAKLARLAQHVPPISQLVRERALFADDCHLVIDYTRQRVSEEILDGLFNLGAAVGIPDLREAMFSGEPINNTERRQVLHTALRDASDVASANDAARAELDRMADFAEGVRNGRIRGSTGKRFQTIINIGIGGSDLGPRMVFQALRPYCDPDIDVRFVSNVDPADFDEAFLAIDPETTLVLIASKTFTTAETMSNAVRAREWLTTNLTDAAPTTHMVAISTATDPVRAFGITHQFGFWDWVGGRYSVGSAIGLSVMIAVGPGNFRALLSGFASLDRNFRQAPDRENLALIMGLLAVWNRNFLGIQTLAVLPYAHRLRTFPQYLQQLIMESNGKSVRRDGAPVRYETSAIVWGEAGTGGQHSFHQLIHQGTSHVACDIIIAQRGSHPDQQRALVANALAQAEVFALGYDAAGDDSRSIRGNQPTTLIVTEAIDPETLGALIALYEHSVFVQGAIWGINPFDQFGVEIGKGIAAHIDRAMGTGDVSGLSDLTQTTLKALHSNDSG